MLDYTLFPFIDTAMRVIGVLALCALPLLILVTPLQRALHAMRERLRRLDA